MPANGSALTAGDGGPRYCHAALTPARSSGLFDGQAETRFLPQAFQKAVLSLTRALKFLKVSTKSPKPTVGT